MTTTDGKLKIENLDSELFITDLGRIRGGSAGMTSLAGQEDPGFCDTPAHDHPGLPYADFTKMFDQIIRKALEHTGRVPPYGDEVSTQALGEE